MAAAAVVFVVRNRCYRMCLKFIGMKTSIILDKERLSFFSMGAVVAVAIAICGPCYCCRYDPENVLIQRNIDRERASVINDRVPLEYTHYVHV